MDGLRLDERRIKQERARGIWPDRVVGEYVDRWVAEKPQALALVGYCEEQATTTELTWSVLGERVARAAAALAERGVGKGDVVAFQLPNCWEFVVVHLACVRLGAVSNPLMPIFRSREMSFMVKHADAKVLIAPGRFRGFDHGGLARTLQRDIPTLEHVLLTGDGGEESFQGALEAAGASGRFSSGTALEPNDVMQLLFTSGTTGEPKGVLHTSNTLLGTIGQFVKRMQLTPEEVVFMPSPLAHQAGFAYGLTLALMLGTPLVLLDIWNPARAVELMERYRAASTFAATPFLADLAKHPDIERRRLEAFRLFVTSGAPIPPVVVQLAQERLRANVVASWGMTECCSATTTLRSDPKALTSDGCPTPGGEVRIVDETGGEVPRGHAGILQYRGAALFVGYLKRPQLYDVDSDGWFSTGDIARMDEQGYIRICGRAKDIIIRGGENIPVVEIENALYRMPAVAEVAIVAMPDPRMMERACAFVALHPGGTLTLEEVQAFLAAEGFSKHFWPERLEIVERLPRTATGKVQKYVLRDIAKDFAAEDSGPHARASAGGRTA